MPRKRPPKRPGLGIGARLGSSFAAVALLALVANLVAEYGTSIVTTTTSYATVTSGPEQKEVTNARSGLVSGKATSDVSSHDALLDLTDFLDTVTRFERATEASAQTSSAQSSEEFKRSAYHLDAVTEELVRLAPTAQALAIQSFATHSRALRKSGELLVLGNESRRVAFGAYSRYLESVDHLLKSALDRNWKIFGRVLARQSLLSLSGELDEIRSRAVQMSIDVDPEEAAFARVLESEAQFATTLEQHRVELAHSQGSQWLRQVDAGFANVVSSRTVLMASVLPSLQSRTSFDQEIAALASLMPSITEPRLPGRLLNPSSIAGSNRNNQRSPGGSSPGTLPIDRSETETTQMVPVLTVRLTVAAVSATMLFLLLAVSVATVRSIVRPIRQFMATTRRLSTGEPEARFERGGMAELDTLAASLNEMAETLEAAQAATRNYQDALEVRIDERTRQLQHLAEHDSLTGLPNRRQLLIHLTKALQAPRATNVRVALFFLDLDNFKNINDSMGHTFGDRVLQGIAHRLRSATAPEGFAARLGGDEFMVVYSFCAGVEYAVQLGEQLVASFQRPLLIESRELLVSISVGGSLYPDHEESADALLRAADAALFRAKSLGRNQFSLFSHELLERAAKTFDIEQGLRRAVDRNEFELVFQPQVDFEHYGTQLAEALLRWRLPDRRHISPAQFLSVAKESGLNTRISDWVLRSAIEQVAKWRSGEWPDARVAINVSASQLMGTWFVDQMQELLKAYKVPPNCIEIELTEDILQTGPSTIATLREFRTLGVSIALDDFGTGFSSLASLQQLPLTRVKLDQSLVACIDTDPRSAAIAGAIIRLCGDLGLAVTAEGIERFRQLELLLEHGPICFQGYLISHPLEAGALPAALIALPGKLRSLSSRLSPEPRSRGSQEAIDEADLGYFDSSASESA
jgi:diguanylate cyclase (GGDEF)-like protein